MAMAANQARNPSPQGNYTQMSLTNGKLQGMNSSNNQNNAKWHKNQEAEDDYEEEQFEEGEGQTGRFE
jgi:hypothetical protein